MKMNKTLMIAMAFGGIFLSQGAVKAVTVTCDYLSTQRFPRVQRCMPGKLLGRLGKRTECRF